MGIDDFMDTDSSENDDEENPQEGDKLDSNTAIDMIDRNIMEQATVLHGEINDLPEGGRVYVQGNKVIADRRRLATVLAIMLTSLPQDEFKDISELE